MWKGFLCREAESIWEKPKTLLLQILSVEYWNSEILVVGWNASHVYRHEHGGPEVNLGGQRAEVNLGYCFLGAAHLGFDRISH